MWILSDIPQQGPFSHIINKGQFSSANHLTSRTADEDKTRPARGSARALQATVALQDDSWPLILAPTPLARVLNLVKYWGYARVPGRGS